MSPVLNPFADSVLSVSDLDEPSTKTDHAILDPNQSHSLEEQSFLKRLVQSGEGEMARNRLVISAGIFSYFLIETLVYMRELTFPLIIISCFFVFSSVLSWHILRSPAPNYRRRITAMSGDIATLTTGLIVGGSATAFTFPVYLWIIFGNGFRFGIEFLTLSSVAAATGFSIVFAASEFWYSFHNLSAGLLISLIVLPLYARKLINDLSNARQKSEAANELKSRFLASVSHELRTPLNAVIGLSDLLSATTLKNDQREMAASINASGRSLCGLIDNLLDYSRLEAGAMPTQNKPFCIISMLTEIESVARAQARDKKVAVHLSITPRTPLDVSGDQGKITQILTNLIANAIKFTDRGFVALSVDGSPASAGTCRYRFDVVDTGIGISEVAQKQIFERFTQADAGVVDKYGGTGLGLAIVKQLVTLLGGSIQVTSAPGKGSTFRCDIILETRSTRANIANQQSLNVAVLTRCPDLYRQCNLATDNANITRIDSGNDLKTWLSGQQAILSSTVLIADQDLTSKINIQSVLQHSPLLTVIDVTNDDGVGAAKKSNRAPPFAQVSRIAIDSQLRPCLDAIDRRLACKRNAVKLASPAGDGEGLSILVAEDNHANQMVIRRILSHAGHRPTIVEDGDQALDTLAAGDYDVALLDLNMPRMNGFDVVKYMHFALHEQVIPVLALTADASAETSEKCAQAGFDACLTKPYNANQLLETLNDLRADQPRKSGLGEEVNSKDGEPLEPVSGSSQGPLQSDTLSTIEYDDALDTERVDMLAGLGDPAFFSELVVEFDGEVRTLIGQLVHAARSPDYNEIRRIAHALKSSAVNFGARKLVENCEDLEHGSADELAASANQKIDAIAKHYVVVQEALHARANISIRPKPVMLPGTPH